jgi:hypothetical protein
MLYVIKKEVLNFKQASMKIFKEKNILFFQIMFSIEKNDYFSFLQFIYMYFLFYY